jgi:hypothetical protein
MTMNGFDSLATVWFLVAVQAIGVTSACVTRLSEGSSRQALSQVVFLGMLPLSGAATVVAFAIGLGWWLACSATLALMILTVTCDFRSGRQRTTW